MVNAACIDVGQLMNITVILLFMQCPPINELLGSVRNEGIRQTMSSLAFLTFQVRMNYNHTMSSYITAQVFNASLNFLI